MGDSAYVRLCAPAWWCEPCQSWWPGGWGPVYVGAIPAPDLDLFGELQQPVRTCAECGQRLVPRARTVAVAELRSHDEGDDG